MKPASPVFTQKYVELEVVYAKDQPQYMPLPALRIGEPGIILTRWRMSWRERLIALFRGSVYLQVMTHDLPLQPVSVFVDRPKESA